jgi:hypothetical protein
MRFDKETRAKIHEAAPGSVTIRWPAGQRQPEKGATYRVQSAEDVEKAQRRLEESPPKMKDVMAQMYKRKYKEWPEGYKPPRAKVPRPSKDDDMILVLGVEPADGCGWDATVALHEEADPIRHSGVKATVAGGLDPLSTIAGDPITGHTSTEMEPEQIIVKQSRSEREDEADSLRIEHEASVDAKEIGRAQKRLSEQRRKGKTGTLAAQALERAKRRADRAGT